MSEKQLKPVIAYARYSSTNQREASIEEQMDIVNSYAKKHGMQIKKWFRDSAISGTSMKGRNGMEELLSYLSSHIGDISYVLCHKLDRLSRDSGDISVILKKVKYCGAEIICVTDNLNTGDPFSTMNIALASGMAQHYSENLSREVRRGLEYNAKKGESTGGIPPLGYDIDGSNKKLIINDAEAEIVQLIFERYGEDNFSYKDIVKELCKKGYKTKVGNDFKKTSLHEILRNEKYKGTYTYNKKSSKDIYGRRNNHKNKPDDEIIRIQGGCPRIISDELWDKVQSRLANNEMRTYSTEERYLLRNKIFCGECGERMYGNRRKSGKNKKLYVTYNCSGRQRGNGCTNKGINREYIEKFVMVQIKSAFLPKNKAKTIAANLNTYIKYRDSDLEKSLDEYRRKRQNAQAKIKRLINSISHGISADIVADDIASLEKQKANWERKIEEAKRVLSQRKIKTEDIQNAMDNYYELMNSDEIIVRKFIDKYVEKVLVFQDHIEIILNVNRQITNPVAA